MISERLTALREPHNLDARSWHGIIRQRQRQRQRYRVTILVFATIIAFTLLAAIRALVGSAFAQQPLPTHTEPRTDGCILVGTQAVGRWHGIRYVYAADGQLLRRATWRHGHQVGPIEEYYHNGAIRLRAELGPQGLPVGTWESYREDGSPESVERYDMIGRLHGECIYYAADGTSQTEHYLHGTLIL